MSENKDNFKTKTNIPAKLDEFPKGPNLGLFFDLKRNRVTKYVLASLLSMLAIASITFGLSMNQNSNQPKIAKATALPSSQPRVSIDSISIVNGNYSVAFTTVDYTNTADGMHTHFYYNNEPQTVLNKMYSGASPYLIPLPNVIPATKLCAIVANSNHTVIPDSGNCATIPNFYRASGDLNIGGAQGISNIQISNTEVRVDGQPQPRTVISYDTGISTLSSLKLGLTPDSLQTVVTETEPTTTHSMALESLLPCTTYYFVLSVSIQGVATITSPTNPPLRFTSLDCNGTVNSDETVIDKAISTVRKAISKIDANQKGISLDIPAGTFPEDRTVQISQLLSALNSSGDGVSDSPSLPSGLKPIKDKIFEIKDYIGSYTAPTGNFNQPITFTIDFTPADIAGLDPNTLTVKSWEGAGNWLDHDCTKDLANNKITCTTTHFTTFVLAGNPISVLCSQTDPCALFESELSFSPLQSAAKRYGASGSTASGDLTLKIGPDARFTSATVCNFKYKFRTDTSYRTLATNVVYDTTNGCSATLLKADQLLFNADFEISANTGTTDYFLMYANYDFKAGSIGVTSIGGSGL